MFPGVQTLPDSFPLAKYAGTFEETLGDQKYGVEAIFRKLEPDSSQSDVAELWKQFWDTCMLDVTIPQDTAFVEPFRIPKARQQHQIATKKRKISALDDGNRLVEVVTSSDFNSSARKKALKVAQTISDEGAGLSPLNKGDIVVIEDADIMPTHQHTLIFFHFWLARY